MHVAFEILSGIIIPGDLSSAERYFVTDLTGPPFVLENGAIVLNQAGYEAELGCELEVVGLSRQKRSLD